jgi:hypothetical protein
VHSAVDTLVGFRAEPLLGELIQVHSAVVGGVADEEVVLDVGDHPLVLALGPMHRLVDAVLSIPRFGRSREKPSKGCPYQPSVPCQASAYSSSETYL